jgi:sugar (pentulose or hexulose) kinase
MKLKCLLGIDVGTTMMKSVVFDLKGNEIGKASYGAEILHPRPGWAEQDMHAVWKSAALSIRDAISKSGVAPKDILCVSLSGQGAGTWLIDQEGRPTRNAVSWLDGRAGTIIDEWKESGISDKLVDTCGLVYYSGSGPGIIFPWFMRNNRKVLDDSAFELWAKDWVRYCLTGEIMTDETDPSMGMIDPKTRRYSQEVMELTGIGGYSRLLPPIKPSHEIGGKVTKAAAEATELAEGTPVAVGAWDVSSTALGQGAVRPNQAVSIVGTAGIHLVVTDNPVVNRAYSLSCHTVPGQWFYHSMAMTAANNLDWFEKEFCLAERQEAERKNLNKYDIFNQIVAETPVGSNGVMFLPFLQGERAPFVEPRARGEFFGLGEWSTKGDLLRAVYEGVALATLHNYRAMERGTQFESARLGGGGAQSEVWTQIIADCTGKVMEVTSGSEYGARGAAINAAIALGIYDDHQEAAEQMVQVKRVYEPDSKKSEIYQELFDIYVKLIENHMKLWVEMYGLVEDKLVKAKLWQEAGRKEC